MARHSQGSILRLGAVSLVVLFVVMAAAFNLQKFPGFKGTDYHVQLADASGLHKGNMVQIAGIRVGRVSGLHIHGDHVTVDVNVKGATSGEKTLASVQVLNLLGEKYLELTPRGSGEMEGGDTIPVSRTNASYDIVSTLGELTTTTEAIDIPRLSQALTTLGDTVNAASPHIASTFTGLSRMSQAIASRDESIQRLLGRADRVTALLSQRRGDLVTLMKQGDLVFKELIARREAIHALLVHAEKLAIELRGVATDNQAQIGAALTQLDKALGFLRGREKQIDTTLTNLGPYASILINIIGTGPWFDAFVPNFASLGTGEFVPRESVEMTNRVSVRALAIAAAVVLLAVGFFVFAGGGKTRTVTAYFDRTVSLYKGSEVRVMGVNIGTVKAVVPEGDRVRVSMEYDAEYKLPADAKAAIVTPTLTADRFVQIAPAYTGGPVMADKARIDLPKTGTPVELDRIYQSLSDLTQALGPNGVNKDGSLNTLLTAGANALRGNGQLGNQTLRNLSGAVQTFGDSRGPLFDSVKNMSQLTDTLAANDQAVDGFMSDLTSVSTQLAADRDNLGKALAALARAVGTVRTFVHGNKSMVQKDVRELTRLLGVTARHKDDLNTLARIGALGLDNLTVGFDNKTNTQGSRVQSTPNGANLGNMLCDIIYNSGKFPGASGDNTCQLLRTLVKPFSDQIGADPSQNHDQPAQLKLGGSTPITTLEGLLNSLKAGNAP